MLTKKHPRTRLARFESLEPRQMLCGAVAAMPSSMPAVATADAPCAEVAKPIVQTEMELDRRTLQSSDLPRQHVVHAIALQEILGERPDAGQMASLVPPADGFADAARTVWSAIKTVSPAALIGEAMIKKYPSEIAEQRMLANASKITVADLQPGDILVFSGDGVVRAGIKFISASNFNHAAIYLGGDKLQVIDATDGGGVSIRSLSDAVRDQNVAVVLRIPGLSAEQVQKIVKTATSWEGAKYSYGNLWAAASGLVAAPSNQKPGVNKPAVICSEFVQKVYRENGFALTNRNFPSPGDLLLSRQVKVVGLVKANGWNPVSAGSGCC